MPDQINLQQTAATLDAYFEQVQTIILERQDWISGLLPASMANNAYGNYHDAWVRDNVYSILAAWGLALAYRRNGRHNGKAYLLEQSVVKLMRGLLVAMMRQAHKVEKFKQTRNPLDALHAKYDLKTGEPAVGDAEWGHLQLDATSLYLLMLAQMTASGLRIVFSLDEVSFVQNLVHYISLSYRTPDYGIWERGNKINRGIAELNASSIGMAKAALEALSGFNLFGPEGEQSSVIHVISDDIARSRITLESLLPRESISKELDAAVLSITGFPAFSVDDQALKTLTETRIAEKLEGRYGCKRFLLDGHQTELEDPRRLYYEPHELKQFADIECEWPLFFCYLFLNHLFAGNHKEADVYHAKLEALMVEKNGTKLLPELYKVPANAIAAEKTEPHSQARIPNENIPLVWAQSLFILGNLLKDGLLEIEDIDPLGRHVVRPENRTHILQVALIAEDETIQSDLKKFDIPSQTLAEISPVQIRGAAELAQAYTHVGRNDRYGLTGRPFRHLRTLSTSRIYLMANSRLVFLPQLVNQKGFYLAMDNRLLIQRLRSELPYIQQHWDSPGNPLFVLVVKYNMLSDDDRYVLTDFIKELQAGHLNGTPVELGFLPELAKTSSCEKIDYLHDFEFSKATWEKAPRPCFLVLPIDTAPPEPLSSLVASEWEHLQDTVLIEQVSYNPNPYGQLEALALLAKRHGLQYDLGLIDSDGNPCLIRDLLEELYIRAGDIAAWDIIRRCAGLLGKYDIDLEQAATEILVRQHQLTVGKAYSSRSTLKRPVDFQEILDIIRTFNDIHDSSEHIIIQELIVYLGLLIRYHRELFDGMHTIRVGHILHLLVARQKKDSNCTLDEGYNEILAMPPFQLMQRVHETLENITSAQYRLDKIEELNYLLNQNHELKFTFASKTMDPENSELIADWYEWRERQGSLGRENDSFFLGVWEILHHCKGLTIGDKLDSKRRIDSETTLAQMTSGEQSFRLHVEHLLNKIQAPVYRQLTVEALNAIGIVFRTNPSLTIDDTLVIDIVIGHAVRLCWLKQHPGDKDPEHIAFAWQAFYRQPPHQVANCILDALFHLLEK